MLLRCDVDEKKLHWPWLLKVLLAVGIGLGVIGLALAVGQVLGIGWFVVGRGDSFAALQVHLNLVAIGGAVIAISYAVGAYQLQRRELKAAEEQLRIQKQQIDELRPPHVEVRWAENPNEEGVTVKGNMATAMVEPREHPRHMTLSFSLFNKGGRLASRYEVAVTLPSTITVAGFVGQCEIFGDRYVPKPIRYQKREQENHVLYSWVVEQDRELVLVPNGTPVERAFLQIDRHPNGPLQSARDNLEVWGEHDIYVMIYGDWGSNGPQPLKLRLELVNTSS